MTIENLLADLLQIAVALGAVLTVRTFIETLCLSAEEMREPVEITDILQWLGPPLFGAGAFYALARQQPTEVATNVVTILLGLTGALVLKAWDDWKTAESFRRESDWGSYDWLQDHAFATTMAGLLSFVGMVLAWRFGSGDLTIGLWDVVGAVVLLSFVSLVYDRSWLFFAQLYPPIDPEVAYYLSLPALGVIFLLVVLLELGVRLARLVEKFATQIAIGVLLGGSFLALTTNPLSWLGATLGGLYLWCNSMEEEFPMQKAWRPGGLGHYQEPPLPATVRQVNYPDGTWTYARIKSK